MQPSDRTPAARGATFTRLYSGGFVVLVLGLLLSLAAQRTFSPSTIQDSFRWHSEFIQSFDAARFRLGDRLFNGAVRGSQGWIMYTGEASIPDYQHTIPVSDEAFARWQAGLDALNAGLKQQHRTLLVVIAPNKNTIYGTHMPAEIPVLHPASLLEQFTGYMRRHGQTPVLDLTGPLLDASRSRQVYYSIDTHWNDDGAYVGYSEIIKALAPQYPNLVLRPLSDFKRTSVTATRDLARVMGMPRLEETYWSLAPAFPVQLTTRQILYASGARIRFTTGGDGSLPSLLIMHDSFYEVGLGKLLEPDFSRVTALSYNSAGETWPAAWLLTQPSDIVIIEITERNLFVLGLILRNLPPGSGN